MAQVILDGLGVALRIAGNGGHVILRVDGGQQPREGFVDIGGDAPLKCSVALRTLPRSSKVRVTTEPFVRVMQVGLES